MSPKGVYGTPFRLPPFGGFAKVPESLALTKSSILCAPRVTGTSFRVTAYFECTTGEHGLPEVGSGNLVTVARANLAKCTSGYLSRAFVTTQGPSTDQKEGRCCVTPLRGGKRNGVPYTPEGGSELERSSSVRRVSTGRK